MDILARLERMTVEVRPLPGTWNGYGRFEDGRGATGAVGGAPINPATI
jgi:hypothetical protein